MIKDVYKKYIKYKSKYINLKKMDQTGGSRKKMKFNDSVVIYRDFDRSKLTGTRQLKNFLGEKKMVSVNPYLEFDDATLLKITSFQSFQALVHRLSNFGINISESVVLDLGCGHGNKSFALSRHFKKVYGVDPSFSMLEKAKENCYRLTKLDDTFDCSKVEFLEGSFDDIPEIEFDIIFMFNSIHYSKSIENTLDNVFKHVKEGGIIFILEPHDYSKFDSKKLNENQDARESKLEILRTTRVAIKKYVEEKEVKVLVTDELPLEILFFHYSIVLFCLDLPQF